MRPNVGGADRIVRAVAGIAVIAAGVYYHAWWGWIGAVLLATSAIGFCPLYLPFRLNTRGRSEP